jgi:phosphoglycerate dehydrogenase-like enzyme
LYKKNLGILGLGNIGKEVARRGLGFGMKVLAYDPIYVPMDFFVEITTKEKVIAESDFISLHLPLNKKEGPVIGKKELDMMKNGVIVINCARGGVVDENALLEALNSGKVAGAGIDVFVNEPPTDAQKALINHPNVSVTPHIGASTKEAQDRVGIEIANKVVQALSAAGQV